MEKEIVLKHSRPGYAKDHNLDIDLKYLNTIKKILTLSLLEYQMQKIKDLLDIDVDSFNKTKNFY